MFLVPYSIQVRDSNGAWIDDKIETGVKEYKRIANAIWFLRRCWHARDRYTPGIADMTNRVLYLPVYPGLTKRQLTKAGKEKARQIRRLTEKDVRGFEARWFRVADSHIRIDEPGGELEYIKSRY